MDVLTLVESRVRDGVRSRGIDPLSQPEAVRELVDAEVASVLADRPVDADELAGDARALTRQAFSAIAGFGSLQQFLDDDTSRRSGSTVD